MPGIMGHCHVYPGGFGEEKRDEFGVPGTCEHLAAFVRACGFDQAQALAPVEDPDDAGVNARIDGADGLEWLMGQPFVGVGRESRLLATATITPHRPEAVEKLRRARARGVRMLKFHPLIMRCDPLDPACGPFFEEAARARMPVVYHTGAGDWRWPTESARPQVCAELAVRCPELPILMAHCGAFRRPEGFKEAVAACVLRPNLHLDATVALLPIGAERWRRALAEVGPGRVVYGTDYPWASPESIAREMEFLDSLGLDGRGLALVLGGNLRGLWEQAAGEGA